MESFRNVHWFLILAAFLIGMYLIIDVLKSKKTLAGDSIIRGISAGILLLIFALLTVIAKLFF